jgi:hypothetical protein
MWALRRFTGYFLSASSGKTRSNLERIQLQFKVASQERVIVYGWEQQVAELKKITKTGYLYTLYATKTMTNVGIDSEGGSLDRGGDMPFRLLFDETSRYKPGKANGGIGEKGDAGGDFHTYRTFFPKSFRNGNGSLLPRCSSSNRHNHN